MTFIVTARKWRPQLFDEVVGQSHISTTLKNAIESNRIGHAYIFAGPRGVGKTTTARILAKRLNCLTPNGGEPCNNCDSCQNFLKSKSLDIIEIDGASNRRIDEIRTLRESVKYAPTSGKYKVYIIDEVHMLTTESFNALLKTLEEPPEHTIFIFATTDIHKVPLTIISRCQRFDFRRIELDEIKTLLKKIADAESIKIDDESLTIIAKKADGALRDAESIFDQVVSFCGDDINVKILRQMLNIIDDDIYFKVSDAIVSKDFKTAYEVPEAIYKNGWNYIDFMNGLLEHFRNISTVVITKSGDYIESSKQLKSNYLKYIDIFSEGDLLRILSFLSKAQSELRVNPNHRLKIEITLSTLIGFEKSTTISKLLSDIESVNQQQVKKKVELKPVPENSTFINNLETQKPKPKPTASDNIASYKPSDKQINLSSTKPGKTLSIDQIFAAWESFVNYVKKEKMTLGILFNDSTPKRLIDNKLEVLIGNEEDLEIINYQKTLVNKFISDFFNSKLDVFFNINKSSIESIETKQVPKIKDKPDDNVLIKAIKEELGGKEIK